MNRRMTRLLLLALMTTAPAFAASPSLPARIRAKVPNRPKMETHRWAKIPTWSLAPRSSQRAPLPVASPKLQSRMHMPFRPMTQKLQMVEVQQSQPNFHVKSLTVTPSSPTKMNAISLYFHGSTRVYSRTANTRTGYALIPWAYGSPDASKDSNVVIAFKPWVKGRYLFDVAVSNDGTLYLSSDRRPTEQRYGDEGNLLFVVDFDGMEPAYFKIYGSPKADGSGMSTWAFLGCQVSLIAQ